MLTRRHFAGHLSAFAAAAAAGFLTLSTAPAFAVGNLVDVGIVDRGTSQLLPTYAQGATWVAGRPGARYAVRLANRSAGRVLVVLSVDGVNAISGETAGVGQIGYVLGPYESTEITGWRKNLNEAAAFYFTALPDSYAARTDRPDNVGVIGAAVFREKAPRFVPRTERRDESAAPSTFDRARSAGSGGSGEPAMPVTPAPAAVPAPPGSTAQLADAAKAQAAPREERLGTGHGEREYSPISEVDFQRASSRPNELVRVRYDSFENLVASGIVRPRQAPPVPDPFPRFVPDPKG